MRFIERILSASTTDAATTTSATSTATTTPPADTSFIGRLFASLTSRIIAWFADAMNGITKFFAGEVHAKDKLCVDDVCVTRDQFAEVFGNQSAAAGASPIEQSNSTGQANTDGAREAPDGSSASGAGEMTDTATTTTPDNSMSVAGGTSPVPSAANDNLPAQAGEPATAETEPAAQAVEDQPQVVAEEPTPAPAILEPANDNTPPPTAEAI